MAAPSVSVVRKLQRCERITNARRDECHIIHQLKYKIKIKASCASAPAPSCLQSHNVSSSTLSFDTVPLAELRESLRQITPAASSLVHHVDPGQKLPAPSNERAAGSPVSAAKPILSLRKTDSLVKMLADEFQKEKLPFCFVPDALQPETSDENITKEAWWGTSSTGASKQIFDENKQEDDAGLCRVESSSPRKLQSQSNIKYGEEKNDEEDYILQPNKEKKKKVLQGKSRVMKEWEIVKKIECECCKIEEECTKGYEERVRRELCGHWLCGLCKEAVREEQQRLGGRAGGVRLETALQAHMKPCQSFSSQAHSKATPPPSAVAVPHAVCRLLRRHLSTPSTTPRLPPSSCSSLPRSSSCLPSLIHCSTNCSD